MMINNAELTCLGERIELRFDLHNDFAYNQCTKVVYQNKLYSFRASIDNVEDDDYVELFLNNKVIGRYDSNSKTYYASEQMFSTLFGYAQFCVVITKNDSKETVFWSDYLIIAIENDDYAIETEKSLTEMLDAIYNTQFDLLYNTGSPQRTLDYKALGESNFKTLDTDIALLNNIVKIYSRNLTFFVNNRYTKARKIFVEDDFDKVNVINSDVLAYIVSHQEQLTISKSTEGFKVGRSFYYPQKALIEKTVFDSDVYENRLVLGFIKYIYIETKNKINTINQIVDNSIKISVKLNNNDYILSSSVIAKLTQFRINEYKKELERLSLIIFKLYIKYQDILSCSELLINPSTLPRPTNIIYSKPHYRNIYDVIINWFKSGTCNYAREKAFMNFVTADQIYEYYCLISIISVFRNNNYKPEKLTSITYESPTKRKLLIANVSNLYRFTSEINSVYLYYQPVIYSDIKYEKHGLDLFRVDRSYYTPDFVIKFCNGEKERYLILDSKWSNRSSIRNNEYADVLFKYGMSIKCASDLNVMNSVWLLQGKNDVNPNVRQCDHLNSRKVVFNHTGAIDNEYYWRYGIATLTPKSGDEALKSLLQAFINNV